MGSWTPLHRAITVLVLAVLLSAAGTVIRSGEVAAARCGGLGGCATAPQVMRQGTAEEELAAKYAPIMELREQTDSCGREAYRPMPVEVVLGNPSVRLVQPGPDGPSSIWGPTAADLYRARENQAAYLDLPGNPNAAGCTYPRDFARFGADAPAVTYAHIQTEKGYLALQYWFYYYFNDWNNQHESDWEMIQLLFRADSAAEALTQEPLRVSFAQHSEGETAKWDDPKLEKEGDHPVVYASAGSHASYFDRKVYLGLGEQGTGLGCDDAAGRARRVPLEARLVPEIVSGEDDPYAWSVFQGRWGQREPGQNNGPRGPNATKRWTQPVTHFDEDIRDYNVTVPTGRTLGPNAIQVFCEVVSLSGQVLDLYYRSPVAVVLSGGALVLVIGTFFVTSTRATFFKALAGPSIDRGDMAETAASARITEPSAVTLYQRHLGVFLAIGAIFIPIGIAIAWLNDALQVSIGGIVLALSVFGSLPLFGAFVVVNAAVAAALKELEAGRHPNALGAYRAVWTHGRALLWATIKAGAAFSLLAITIVGLPFAIDRIVRWLFLGQAIVLDGADSRTALKMSARAVRGHWWRTAVTALVLGVVATLTGPVVAIAALAVLRVSADTANVLSSVIYAFVLPLVFIALTQFYRGLRTREADAAGGPDGANPSDTHRTGG